MASAVQNIITIEEKKCDKDKLEKVIEMIGDKKTFSEIMHETQLSLFELSTYLEVAFYQSNHDPSIYVDTEKVTKIMSELKGASFPTLKEIKSKYPECEYTDIRTVRGVYFRTKRYYQKKSTSKTNKKDSVEQISLFGSVDTQIPAIEKIDITTVPYLENEIKKLETEHWKKFARELFSKYTPKQFFILPASMSTRKHHETELTIGEFDIQEPKKLVKMGGKYYHSIRVLNQLEEMLETDNPEIWDYKGIKVINYVYGNEFSPWQKDAMKVAALSHDIYSGGVKDEFDPNMKYMDKHHAHYHKKELLPIASLLPEEEWNTYIAIVDNHMWKWDPIEPSIKFHQGKDFDSVEECYNHYILYRMVKWVEFADYLASRRHDNTIARLRQALETWYYIKGNLDITPDNLDAMGFDTMEIKKDFSKENEPFEEIIKIVLGKEKYEKMNK
ncbi:HD domain-containing protein [Alkaliphilus sp. B6464]|uniref:HD domain-containing protein n=1 Tax=Alkaliphilus sp. B6464 TaxID=2731219 RepID=UPI001BA6BB04|nr:HD domain-containing protein [Alkaliphilus sp. B6464]QUH22040.1 HD domain-containing protein [Alkaliphilus sp. B6464]